MIKKKKKYPDGESLLAPSQMVVLYLRVSFPKYKKKKQKLQLQIILE